MDGLIKKKQKKDVKGFILKQTFKLLLDNNIEKITVPVLEQHINIHRGGLFYYIKNKEGLFNQVIEIYFFSELNIFYPINSSNVSTLKEYISLKEKQLKEISTWFKQENIKVGPFLGFSNIISQAKRYFPYFDEKYQMFIGEDKLNWFHIVKKSIEEKEINTLIDTELLVELFRNMYMGVCFSCAYEKHKLSDTKQAIRSMKILYQSLCS